MGKKQDLHHLQSVYANATLLHKQGELARAIELYRLLCREIPDSAAPYYNLGLAHYESGQYREAVEAYNQAARLDPTDGDILYNLGLACAKAGKYDDAEAAYLDALDHAEDSVDILYNLGCCYIDADAPDKALIVFENLVEIEPDHISGLNNLAFLHHLQDNLARAEELYARVLELDPERQSARHMHATLSGREVEAPPPEYVRELFDRYSEYFEENLTRDLECTIYQSMHQVFDQWEHRKNVYDNCIDLGCGTGLAGVSFRSACMQLTGIDLSAKMIGQAAAKDIYDTLEAADLTAFLARTDTLYDLILGADVLPYLGDLEEFFSLVTRGAAPDALCCLSAEWTTERDWKLQLSGRYAHSSAYISRMAEQYGWKVLHAQLTNLRREHDTRIKGTIFLLGKNS